MRKFDRFKVAFGMFVAPLLFVIGRLLNSKVLRSLSTRCDVFFIRGYFDQLQAKRDANELAGQFFLAIQFIALTQGRAEPIVKENISRSKSQLLQDLVCLFVHGSKQKGYFVEVGVGDGIRFSNSYLLETHYGWTGILAEPARSFHDSISKSRSAKLEKRAIFEFSNKDIAFHEDEHIGEHSGLVGLRQERGVQKLSTYTVTTVSLDDMLDEHKAPDYIDFMSIDTEGSELRILKGFSMMRRRVGFFAIEHNYNAERLKELSATMHANGYVQILESMSRFDAWFVDAAIDPSQK